MNWLHLGLVLALVAGTSGIGLTTAASLASAPEAAARMVLPPPPHTRTGFNCLLPTEDRWEPCSNYRLEANI